MSNLIDKQMKLANEQYKILAKNVPSDRMPKSLKDGVVQTSDTKWWCSGFFPGSLIYIYEYTKDQEIKAELDKRLQLLEPEKHFKGNHDLGFMMYCSFGNAYRVFKKPEYKYTIDTAAMSLATRYNPDIKVIKSWEGGKLYTFPVIIDNMMNLELLLWVAQHGGDPYLKQIALEHTESTIKNHYRPDFSSYHVVDYDPKTGNVIKKVTHQGYNDESAWARGNAWGFYGFVTMYRFTKDKRYLDQAIKIGKFLINHKNLPKDKIPYWDFDTPDIPNTYRDASAGAIIASALLELGQYVNKKESKKYVSTAEKIIRSLSSDDYFAKSGTNGGFLLMHSVGSLPHNGEVDSPLTYADYYYLESLQRYKNWYLKGK
jgi:rhamnogalacturonyl hydrolase YesR